MKDKQEDVKIISCRASMRLVGELVSRTTVHQKATIEEATNAVKQDILRSLTSRLELHWDSVIEEENGSPEGKINLINIFMHHFINYLFIILIFVQKILLYMSHQDVFSWSCHKAK